MNKTQQALANTSHVKSAHGYGTSYYITFIDGTTIKSDKRNLSFSTLAAKIDSAITDIALKSGRISDKSILLKNGYDHNMTITQLIEYQDNIDKEFIAAMQKKY